MSKSTLSLWLRDVPLTEEHGTLDTGACAAATGPWPTGLHARRRADAQAEARAQIGQLTESELFVAGVVAYWAEGAKNKPWRTGTAGAASSTPIPALIRLFLAWLRLVGVAPDRLRLPRPHPRVGRRRSVRLHSGPRSSMRRRASSRCHAEDAQPRDGAEERRRPDYHGCLSCASATELRAQSADRRLVRGAFGGRRWRR